MDLLEQYLDHVAAHGGRSIEFVVHGGRPGGEAERVHLRQPNWAAAVAAARSRDLEVHLHAPLTPEYRLGRWATDRFDLAAAFAPIVELLLLIERGQLRPPVLILHGATVTEPGKTSGEAVTAEFVTWLADLLAAKTSGARIAIELRLRTSGQAERFDHQISSLVEFVSDLDIPVLGLCWDIANHLGGAEAQPLPGIKEVRYISHVHLHDRHPDGGGLHAPLGTTGLPWRRAIGCLQNAGWNGAITLEIRYRYALELGQPWDVLAASFDQVRRVLTEE